MDCDITKFAVLRCKHGLWEICDQCNGLGVVQFQAPNDEYWTAPFPCNVCKGIGWIFTLGNDFIFLKYHPDDFCDCMKQHLHEFELYVRRSKIRIIE